MCAINLSTVEQMKIDSMKEMFARSEEEFGMKYVNYIGDADLKIFEALLDLQPYGEGVILKKKKANMLNT